MQIIKKSKKKRTYIKSYLLFSYTLSTHKSGKTFQKLFEIGFTYTCHELPGIKSVKRYDVEPNLDCIASLKY